MLIQMLALKETVKMQHYDYTSTLLYIEESLLITLITMAMLIN